MNSEIKHIELLKPEQSQEYAQIQSRIVIPKPWIFYSDPDINDQNLENQIELLQYSKNSSYLLILNKANYIWIIDTLNWIVIKSLDLNSLQYEYDSKDELLKVIQIYNKNKLNLKVIDCITSVSLSNEGILVGLGLNSGIIMIVQLLTNNLIWAFQAHLGKVNRLND